MSSTALLGVLMICNGVPVGGTDVAGKLPKHVSKHAHLVVGLPVCFAHFCLGHLGEPNMCSV